MGVARAVLTVVAGVAVVGVVVATVVVVVLAGVVVVELVGLVTRVVTVAITTHWYRLRFGL